jgi:hypothetical protein
VGSSSPTTSSSSICSSRCRRSSRCLRVSRHRSAQPRRVVPPCFRLLFRRLPINLQDTSRDPPAPCIIAAREGVARHDSPMDALMHERCRHCFAEWQLLQLLEDYHGRRPPESPLSPIGYVRAPAPALGSSLPRASWSPAVEPGSFVDRVLSCRALAEAHSRFDHATFVAHSSSLPALASSFSPASALTPFEIRAPLHVQRSVGGLIPASDAGDDVGDSPPLPTAFDARPDSYTEQDPIPMLGHARPHRQPLGPGGASLPAGGYVHPSQLGFKGPDRGGPPRPPVMPPMPPPGARGGPPAGQHPAAVGDRRFYEVCARVRVCLRVWCSSHPAHALCRLLSVSHARAQGDREPDRLPRGVQEQPPRRLRRRAVQGARGRVVRPRAVECAG